MFEKLITDFKKSLPGPLAKILGVTDDIESGDEDEELDEDERESDESANEDLEEEKKKKMRSMIIKVIVILGLGYFALDEFFLSDMQKNSEGNIALQKTRPKVKKVIEDAGPPEKIPSETVPEADTTLNASPQINEVSSDSSQAKISEDPPIENINVLEKTEEEASTLVETQPEEQSSSEAKVGEIKIDHKLDQLIENAGPVAENNPIEEVKIPSSGEVAPSMVSKIVEGVIETPPPAYDQVGRGLVYNCKDKYWACLDKPAYVACNKNQKWNKSKGNAAECAISDVYSSEEDCAKVQKYNVSTNAPTAFCQD